MNAHLTLRVAWHDSKWNGAICQNPAANSYCVALSRIREAGTAGEEDIAGKGFDTLTPGELPPCKAESGFFMSPKPWVREFDHPYRQNKKCAETHGILKKRLLTIPPHTAIAVPFKWMLRRNQKQIDSKLPTPLAPDENAPFASPWVFGQKRQEALLGLVFGRVTKEKSLVFFYTKEGHPLGDSIRRLVVGLGRIVNVGKCEHYDTVSGKQGYALWDRLISHSIRPDGDDGFLLPYHEYLAPTGDAKEDERRAALLREIIVTPPESNQADFSYGTELTDADVALSVLNRALASVRKIREHGIVPGPWKKREEWLNRQIDLAWKDRGAFPGTGAALEALGMRLGTVLFQELRGSGVLKPETDPWPVLNELFDGSRQPPNQSFSADIKATAPTWQGLAASQRELLSLLSRFDLTPAQALRVGRRAAGCCVRHLRHRGWTRSNL